MQAANASHLNIELGIAHLSWRTDVELEKRKTKERSERQWTNATVGTVASPCLALASAAMVWIKVNSIVLKGRIPCCEEVLQRRYRKHLDDRNLSTLATRRPSRVRPELEKN